MGAEVRAIAPGDLHHGNNRINVPYHSEHVGEPPHLVRVVLWRPVDAKVLAGQWARCSHCLVDPASQGSRVWIPGATYDPGVDWICFMEPAEMSAIEGENCPLG